MTTMTLTFDAVSEATPGPKWHARWQRSWPAYEAWFVARGGDKSSNRSKIAQRAMKGDAPQSIDTAEQGEAADRDFTCHVSRNLDGNDIVEHWAIEGEGHAWSGGQPAGSYTDPQGPDASAEMVRFFFDRAEIA